MARSSLRAASFVALIALVVGLLPVGSSLAASATTEAALSWLRTQQLADGGFEVLGAPGFETPDAVLALASGVQSGSWDADAARSAVAATRVGGVGNGPLEALDDLADTPLTKGQAAKLIVLVTNPLGIAATGFDPKCDGGTTDLVTVLGAPGADGQFGFALGALNSILFAARAFALTTGAGDLPDATVTTIRNAQKSDGSWSFDGSNAGTGGDIDTTAVAILTLLEDDDITAADADVDQGLDYLELAQQGDGAWLSFGTADPNSTSQALLALGVGGRTDGLAAGDEWIASQQQGDGRIASPNDGFGINTFATAQAIQGLTRFDVPRATSASPLGCTDTDGVSDAVEWGAPNDGDGNNDGTPDAEQANVTSLPGAAGGFVTVAVEGGAGNLADVTAIDPATQPAPPAGVTLPRGLVGFSVDDVEPGGNVEVRLFLHGGPTLTRYFKLHDGEWQEFTDHASFDGNVVTLTLVDGGPGDDDADDNGTIVDPGGPASVAAAIAAVGVEPTFTG